MLYVALTRAKYSLYIISENAKFNGKTQPKAFIDFIPQDLEREEICSDALLYETWNRGRRKVVFGEVDKAAAEKMQKNFSFVYPFIKETELPLKSSVTATLSKTEYKNEGTINVTETDNERGTIAHKILELTDFSIPFDSQFNNIVKVGGLENDIGKVDISLLKNCVGLIKEKIGKGETYREKSFLCNIPSDKVFGNGVEAPVLIQGIIDLLVIEDGKAKIIDYKYSAKEDEQLIASYKKQLDLYAYAVEHSLNIPVIEKTIVSLVHGRAITV